MAQQDTPAAGSGQTPDHQMREFMDHEFNRQAPADGIGQTTNVAGVDVAADRMTFEIHEFQRPRLEPRTEHIYPIEYLEGLTNLDALERMYQKQVIRARPNRKDIMALCAGVCAMHQALYAHLKSAKADGKLLMCWEGSTVVNLGNEVTA